MWLDSPCTRGISHSMCHKLAFTLNTATFTLHPEGRPSKDCDFASRRHGAVGLLYYKRHQLDARIAWRPEYKTRERIHPGLADPGLLAIPASRGRLQTSIRTGVGFIRISSALRHCNPLYRPLYYACSPRYQRDMLIWRHPHLPLP